MQGFPKPARRRGPFLVQLASSSSATASALAAEEEQEHRSARQRPDQNPPRPPERDRAALVAPVQPVRASEQERPGNRGGQSREQRTKDGRTVTHTGSQTARCETTRTRGR